MAINLLPQELKPKSYALKLSKSLRKIAIFGVVIFLVSTTLVIGAYIVIGNRLSVSIKKQDELKTQIKALEETEKKLVLIKDRLTKTKTVLDLESASQEVTILEDVLKSLHEGVLVEEFDLKTSNATVTLVLANSLDITRFLAKLIGEHEFSKIDLESIDYSPIEGYKIKLSIVR